MRTIALANQKGGTGKTTTAVNLGAALAERKRRVLLVDVDPQSHLTAHLGCEDAKYGTYQLLMGLAAASECVVPEVLPRLDVMPASLALSGAELELAGVRGREAVLREAMRGIVSEYDYVLFDCPPSLGILTVNALAAAREVFIPVQLEWMALRGLGQLLRTVDAVKRRVNPQVEITGVIGCMYKARRILSAQVLETLVQHFGERVFRTIIRENVRLAEAPSHGMPITLYDPRSRGAEDYRSLATEVLRQERKVGVSGG